MRCTHCGYENYAGIQACARCGRRMRAPGPGLFSLRRAPRPAAPAGALALPVAGAEGGFSQGRGWRLWGGLSANASLVFAVLAGLALTLGVGLLAYGDLPPIERLKVAGLLVLAWALLFALAPLIARFAVVAGVLALFLGAFYLAARLGISAPLAIFYAFMAVALIGLLLLLLPFIPGVLAGAAIYQFMQGDAAALVFAAAAVIVITGLVFAAWASFTAYVIPFGRGFLWAFATGALAHRLALTIVTGGAPEAWIGRLAALRLGNVLGSLAQLPGIAQSVLLLDRLPVLLWLWLVGVSAVVGVISIMQSGSDA